MANSTSTSTFTTSLNINKKLFGSSIFIDFVYQQNEKLLELDISIYESLEKGIWVDALKVMLLKQ